MNEHKKLVRVITLLLVAVMMYTAIPLIASADYDYSWFNSKVEELKKKYPNGTSWSDSNTYAGASGCVAFANMMADNIFGCSTPRKSWKQTNIASIVPGDVITTDTFNSKGEVTKWNHTAFVIGVSGNTLTLAEGNIRVSGGNPQVLWGRTKDKNTYGITAVYHATNYDAIINQSTSTHTSGVELKWSTYNDKHWIGETNAVLAKRVDMTGVSNGDVTKIGIYLYDSNEKLLKSFSENVSYGKDSYFYMWYDVNQSTELNYTLIHETTYKYKMFAVVKGETYYSPLESFKTRGNHTYGEWKTVKEATCVSPGEKTKTCTVCGKTETTTVNDPNAKHVGETEIRNARAATCGSEGYTGDTYCKSCGAMIESGTSIAKNGSHSWDEGVVTTPATADAPGVKTYTCSVCGTTKTEEIPPITTDPTDPTDPIATHIPGDINGDKVVNNKDLTRLMKYLAGENVEVVNDALDVNGDKSVNNKDLTRLMKYLAGAEVAIF